MRIDGLNFFKYNLHLPQDRAGVQSTLIQLGLTSTGSLEEDKQQIQEAMQAQAGSANAMPQQGQGQPQTPPEIAEFMSKLGLEPTNNKESDNALITNKLDSLESAAKTDDEKQNVTELREEFAALVANVESGSPGGQVPPNSTVGMEQLGNMNKFFLLG